MLGKRQGKLPEGFGKKLMKALNNEENEGQDQNISQQNSQFAEDEFDFEPGFNNSTPEGSPGDSLEVDFASFDDMPQFDDEEESDAMNQDFVEHHFTQTTPPKASEQNFAVGNVNEEDITFESFDDINSEDEDVQDDDFDLSFMDNRPSLKSNFNQESAKDTEEELFDDEDDNEPVNFISNFEETSDEGEEFINPFEEEVDETNSLETEFVDPFEQSPALTDFTDPFEEETEEIEDLGLDFAAAFDEDMQEVEDVGDSFDTPLDEIEEIDAVDTGFVNPFEDTEVEFMDKDQEELTNNSAPFMDWESELDMHAETGYNTGLENQEDELDEFDQADFSVIEELATALSAKEESFDDEPLVRQQDHTMAQHAHTPVVPNINVNQYAQVNTTMNNDMLSEIAEFTQETFLMPAGNPINAPQKPTSNIPAFAAPGLQQEFLTVDSLYTNIPQDDVTNMHQASLTQSMPMPAKTPSSLLGHNKNLDTLINLVSNLPQGVTKQTGAIIIKQTMEAMGTSMGEVLKNAQNVQLDLQKTVKDKLDKIEEEKTLIKQMEEDIRLSQKKASELSEIINLFIQTGTV